MATKDPAGSNQTPRVAKDQEPDEKPVGYPVAGPVAGYLILFTALLFYVLLQVWPSAPTDAVVAATTTAVTTTTTTSRSPTTTIGGTTTTTAAPPTTQSAVVTVQRTLPDASVRLFGRTFHMSQESRLLVVVAVAGALGGMVHALRSLYWYTGNRRLVRSWLLMYCLLPFVGGLLALIVDLVIRGGFVTGFGPTAEVSPYGAAAMAALVGAFSENASAKLRQVFATLLTPAEQGTDHAPPNLPDIKEFTPTSGRVGTRVTITGSGFAAASSVVFGGAGTSPISTSDTAVTAEVPAGAQTGKISVVTPVGRVTSTEDFTVQG